MSQIAGVITQKNNLGEITHVTIDVRKHREIITPVLEKLGVVEKSRVQQMLESQQWMTPEELRQSLYKKVDELWQK